jgi:hypothetical protein
VLKTAMLTHTGMKSLLPGMTKRGMSKIVGERNSLGKVFIEAEHPADAARDLRHLDTVRQAGSKQIAFVVDEDLSLVFKPPKGRGVDDTVTVSLKITAH